MSKKALATVLALATCYFALLVAASINWRMMHDSTLYMYIAFLMDRFGMVPYRDIFDVNLPGTYLIYFLAGKLSGYEDFGFRLFDLAWLGATLALTYAWLRPAGRYPAWAGAVGFGIAYLQAGPLMSMQRDYFILLPIAVALALQNADRRTLTRAVAAGICLGFAALVKPYAVIFVLPVAALNWSWWRGSADRGRSPLAGIAAMAAGVALPILLAALWLAKNQALAPLLGMIKNYYPLYGSIYENRIIFNPIQRLGILLEQLRPMGGHALWLIPTGIGISLGLARSAGTAIRTLALTAVALVLLAILYPMLSAKFFYYHWLPLQYFAIAGAALCLQEPAPERDRIARLFPPLVFFAVLAVCAIPYKGLLKPNTGEKISTDKTRRADAIAHILAPLMQPGDRVQPLDWTSGAVHAMLELRARPATSFIYTSPFHHHVNNPYILGLREKFMTEMKASRPRFVVRVDADRPWFVGPLTDMTFPVFDQYLADNYREIARGEGFVIFERSSPAGGQ